MLRARVARAVSSWVLNISKDEDSVIVSGQIHSIKTLSYFLVEFPLFLFLPIVSCPITWHP